MWRLLLALLPVPALADSLVVTRAVPAGSTVPPGALTLVAADIPRALSDLAAATGMTARRALLPGQPVSAGDLVATTLIARNQIVALTYRAGNLSIRTEGRALAPAAVGDRIEVLNLGSHARITGLVGEDGIVIVGGSTP